MIRVPIKKEKTGNAIFLIPVAALAGMMALGLHWLDGADRRDADQIIFKIEEYRRHEGHLPNPEDQPLMQGLGFKLAVGWIPDYEPLDSASYRVMLLEGFDGPYWIYESKSSAWRFGYP